MSSMNRPVTDLPTTFETAASGEFMPANPRFRKPSRRTVDVEPLLTADDVAKRLNVSTDWVWDHSSRKRPLLPVIRMGDGTLRYRSSGIEAFIDERERVSSMGRRAG
jgi:hypothetical protein